jgi:hypothetical protein
MRDRTRFDRRTLFGASTAALSCRGSQAASARPPARARLGINLAPPDDYGSELPFADLFRLSREWISQREGRDWGQGPRLDLDPHGWVKHLERGCRADAMTMVSIDGHAPPGTYTVLYDGEGRLEADGAEVVRSAPGRLQVAVKASCDGVTLRLLETNPRNYLRNIRFLRPGTEASYKQNPWDAAFLDRWRGVSALRFMDWQRTNGSKQRRWSDRPVPEQATYTEKGVPFELMIDLATRLEADPWLCIPHEADDDYVRRLATLVRDRLSPRRMAWIEYSNEVWNGMFEQHRHAEKQGQKRGLGGDAFEGTMHYVAQRSTEIFQIAEQVLGGTQRLCRVLPGWAGNVDASNKTLRFRDAGHRADVLAVAPYLGVNAAPEGDPPTAHTIAGWSLDQLFEHLERKVLPEVIGEIKEAKQAADKYGVRLVAYEGGQHLVGVPGAEKDEALTRLFQQANGHPRMGDIYRRYFAAWTDAGGDLFCHYHSVARWSKWGSWGLLQTHDQPPGTSPKFMATMGWARARGQRVKLPG